MPRSVARPTRNDTRPSKAPRPTDTGSRHGPKRATAGSSRRKPKGRTLGNVKDITIDTECANRLTRVTANTVHQVDWVLESFTGAGLGPVSARYGNGGPPRGFDRRR